MFSTSVAFFTCTVGALAVIALPSPPTALTFRVPRVTKVPPEYVFGAPRLMLAAAPATVGAAFAVKCVASTIEATNALPVTPMIGWPTRIVEVSATVKLFTLIAHVAVMFTFGRSVTMPSRSFTTVTSWPLLFTIVELTVTAFALLLAWRISSRATALPESGPAVSWPWVFVATAAPPVPMLRAKAVPSVR